MKDTNFSKCEMLGCSFIWKMRSISSVSVLFTTMGKETSPMLPLLLTKPLLFMKASSELFRFKKSLLFAASLAPGPPPRGDGPVSNPPPAPVRVECDIQHCLGAHRGICGLKMFACHNFRGPCCHHVL